LADVTANGSCGTVDKSTAMAVDDGDDDKRIQAHQMELGSNVVRKEVVLNWYMRRLSEED